MQRFDLSLTILDVWHSYGALGNVGRDDDFPKPYWWNDEDTPLLLLCDAGVQRVQLPPKSFHYH